MGVRNVNRAARGSAFLISVYIALAQTQPKALSASDSLKRFLQNELGELSRGDKTTKYVAAFADLNGDGAKEAIVYVTGQSWCGSGGCNMLVLARDGTSWKEVTAVTITRAPIRVLTTASNGWRNLTVWVQGGGIEPGYEAELRFDGRTYPTNPAVPPARRLTRRVPGRVVLSPSRDGILVWSESGR